MPDKHALAPTPAPIDLGKRRAEGEHAVVGFEIERAHGVRVADGAVVGVVEQQREAFAPPQPAEPRDKGGLIPLVRDDEVSAVAGRLQRGHVIRNRRRSEVGIGLMERRKPRLAVIGEQVLQAPRRLRLEDPHVASAPLQRA